MDYSASDGLLFAEQVNQIVEVPEDEIQVIYQLFFTDLLLTGDNSAQESTLPSEDPTGLNYEFSASDGLGISEPVKYEEDKLYSDQIYLMEDFKSLVEAVQQESLLLGDSSSSAFLRTVLAQDSLLLPDEFYSARDLVLMDAVPTSEGLGTFPYFRDGLWLQDLGRASPLRHILITVRWQSESRLFIPGTILGDIRLSVNHVDFIEGAIEATADADNDTEISVDTWMHMDTSQPFYVALYRDAWYLGLSTGPYNDILYRDFGGGFLYGSIPPPGDFPDSLPEVYGNVPINFSVEITEVEG